MYKKEVLTEESHFLAVTMIEIPSRNTDKSQHQMGTSVTANSTPHQSKKYL